MKPLVPIYDPRFKWTPPDNDCEAFRKRMQKRRDEAQHEAARERAGIPSISKRKTG